LSLPADTAPHPFAYCGYATVRANIRAMPRPNRRRPPPNPRETAKSKRVIEIQRRGRGMASPAHAKIPNSGKENAEGANVDKIRDILFGTQMRDYEKRFVRLEETVM